jgi:hypothetical protein
MKIELDDESLEIVMKTLAEKHIILHWQRKTEEKEELEKVLQKILGLAIDNGKNTIVNKIFETMSIT